MRVDTEQMVPVLCMARKICLVLSDHYSHMALVFCSSVFTNLALFCLGDKILLFDIISTGKKMCCGTGSAGSLPSQPRHGLN